MDVARKMRKWVLGVIILGVLPLFSTDKAFAAPTATVVVVDDLLGIDETSQVTITFSESVTGFDIGDLTAENGTLSNLSTNDSITYFATLTPMLNIYAPTNVITLDNAGVNSGSGAGVGTTPSNNYSVDTVKPTVTSVSDPAAGSYGTGRNLDFTVHMSEPVFVTGTPSIPLKIGSTVVEATYVSGSGTDALFRYTVEVGLLDTDGIAVETAALKLNGGSIKDLAGNDAVVTLNNAGDTSGVLIDSAAPMITGHALGSGNAYVDVMFSEGIYAMSNGMGALTPSDLRLIFASNGGGASAVSIHSLTKTDGGNLTGGETAIRVMLEVTGDSDRE